MDNYNKNNNKNNKNSERIGIEIKEMNNQEKSFDKENMFDVLKNFPHQCEEASNLGKEISISGKITKIVVAGMGGSALVGGILRSYLYESNIPVFVVKDYFLPEYCNKKTLVFIISYSGNTEETLSIYKQAIKKGCRIVVITSGGSLLEIAKKRNDFLIEIPKGYQPRMTLGYQFFPILNVLYNSGIIESPREDIKKTIEALKKPLFIENAKELANKIYGYVPIIYSSNKLEILAYKWKINFNENAKIHSFYNVFPELNHNEMEGYENPKSTYYVVFIKDEDENPRIKKRIEITKDLIKSKGIKVTEISIKGKPLLTKIFSAIYIGDWTAYFLALKYKTDPTPVDLIEEFKKRMSQ